MLQKLRRDNEQGFTLIELMIVIAIIGILAAIAIPNFIQYRRRAYNSAAKSDVKNAYTASQAYFTDYPTAAINLTKLQAYGFRSTDNVLLTPGTGTLSTIEMTSKHGSGDLVFTIDSVGEITP